MKHTIEEKNNVILGSISRLRSLDRLIRHDETIEDDVRVLVLINIISQDLKSVLD